MPTTKIILLIINIIGGIAVIGSYVWGLKAGTGGADALWGGTPASIKPIYAISMLISALGYFAFSYFIFFRLNITDIKPGFWIFYIIFLGILGTSTFWMPLTNIFLTSPGITLWIAIRAVLAIVGLSSCVLAGVLISLHTKETGLAYWLAVAGSAYFAFHTAVLDMIFWPILFKMQ